MNFRYLILILSVSLFCSGCQKELGSPREPGSESILVSAADDSASATGAEIQFKEVLHDLGEIGPGTNHFCEFKFKNVGSEVLKITKVSKTCGCTPFTLEKKEYAPGESGVLKVRYHSDARAGVTTKHLFVSSNDKKNPKISLMIKAKIIKKVDYEPKTLNLTFKGDTAECPDITLRSLDKQPFTITKFMASGECFTVDYDPARKANSFVLKPSVDIEKLKRDQRGVINILLTHPECGQITIPFSLLQRFAVEPRSIVVMNARPEVPIKREFYVMNNYGEAFEIESVSSAKGMTKVVKEEKIDDHRYKFEVELTAPAAENNIKFFSDTLYVNLKGGEKLRIPCRGFYAK